MQPETEKDTLSETDAVAVPPTVPEAVVHETIGVADPLLVPIAVAENGLSEREVSTKRPLAIVALILIAAALAAGAYYWYTKMQPVSMVVGGVEYPAVVAVVNGQEVSVAEFEQSYKQAAAIATQQGYDPVTDAAVQKEVETQALTILVNTTLALQAATAAGHTASDETVDAAVSELETQFGSKEQLATALAGVGLDEAGMRADLAEQIIVDAYIAASPEWQAVTVTDEEIRAYYDLAAGQMEDIPPLTEVFEQIRTQLTTEKQQAATTELLDRLRNEATIEMKI